jgi:XRN-Two Binding Domain, XTBD
MGNEDFDINTYYNPFEPEEQWELKKKFMEAYKDMFDEARLVCLAQVLVNIEFLGCR